MSNFVSMKPPELCVNQMHAVSAENRTHHKGFVIHPLGPVVNKTQLFFIRLLGIHSKRYFQGLMMQKIYAIAVHSTA